YAEIDSHQTDFFCLVRRRPSCSTLFPYTTLFRSYCAVGSAHAEAASESMQQAASAAILPFGFSVDTFISPAGLAGLRPAGRKTQDRKSTRLNSSHLVISYAVFCLKKKKTISFSLK